MSNELIIKIEANQTNGMEVSELQLDGSNITIDWGDSTIDDYSESIEHEYDEEGEYTITITGVSEIHNGLLYGIRNVVEVIVPNNITLLPNEVFRECSNLEKVVLPNGISSIGSRFCYDCPNLVELNLPDGLENIGTYFLCECGLDEVIFPYGISAISGRALKGSNVSNIVIPKSVTSIGDYAFQDCANLSYIEIPNSVESIGILFCQNSSLTTIKFCSETPPTIGVGLLMGNLDCSIHIPEGSLDNYTHATNFQIASGRYVEYPTLKHKLETFGKLMASNLTKQFVTASWDEGLTTLANKVSDIPDFNDIFVFDSSNNYASNGLLFMYFDGNPAKSYYDLKIPSTITTLGDNSLKYYGSMKTCEVPSSVTSIGNNVFWLDQSLEKIIFRGTTPPTATSSSFVTNSQYPIQNIPKTCIILVPHDSLSAYKSASNYPDPTIYTYGSELFWDKNNSNGTNNYTTWILLESGTRATFTTIFDTRKNAYYANITNDGSGMSFIPINVLTGITDNFKLQIDMMSKDLSDSWIALGFAQSEGNGFVYGGYNGYWEGHEYQNNVWRRTLNHNTSSQPTNNTWYILELIKEGTSITINCWDNTHTTNYSSITRTWSDGTNYFGLISDNNTYFKNVRAVYI